jgi:hypothetical protein
MSKVVKITFIVLFLLSIKVTAVTHYNSIPEMIEAMNDYSESNGTFKMISKNHFQLSPMIVENDSPSVIDEQVKRSLIYGIYRTFIHTDLKKITVTVVPKDLFNQKYFKQYKQTISINKKKVEKIATQLFGVSDIKLMVTEHDTWSELFNKGYYNDQGKPTLTVHFNKLAQ